MGFYILLGVFSVIAGVGYVFVKGDAEQSLWGKIMEGAVISLVSFGFFLFIVTIIHSDFFWFTGDRTLEMLESSNPVVSMSWNGDELDLDGKANLSCYVTKNNVSVFASGGIEAEFGNVLGDLLGFDSYYKRQYAESGVVKFEESVKEFAKLFALVKSLKEGSVVPVSDKVSYTYKEMWGVEGKYFVGVLTLTDWSDTLVLYVDLMNKDSIPDFVKDKLD